MYLKRLEEEIELARFWQLEKERGRVKLAVQLAELVIYLEHLLFKDYGMPVLKTRMLILPEPIKAMFKNLSKVERLHIYNYTVGLLLEGPRIALIPPEFQSYGYQRGRKLRRWKKKHFAVRHTGELEVRKEGNLKVKTIELKNYWMRLSNNTDKYAFVLRTYRKVKESK